jgi:protoporphyrinogen oxidase
VDAQKVVENVLRETPSVGWGPNAVFKFPAQGGTGAIWKAVGSRLDGNKLQFNRKVARIDFEKKLVVFADGDTVKYSKLLSTLPLDISLDWLGRGDLARKLRYSSTHVIGLGIRGSHKLEKKCWLYYPEDNCPFYRCTVFSNYASLNCPSSEVHLPTLRLAGGSSSRVRVDIGR